MLRATTLVLAALVALAALAALARSASAQEDAFTLDGLVVTASPTLRSADEVSSFVTVLDGQLLRDRGVTTVLDALRFVAGTGVVQNGSWGATTSLFLRGAESDHALVLVDGVQVNQPGGAFDFAGLGLANVARIEVVRGPASALYGSDAMAGVIHVITRTGRGPAAGSLTTRVGSHGRRDVEASVTSGTDRAGYTLSVARDRTDGILELNNRHQSTVVSGNARLRPDDATDLRLSLRLGDRAYHFPTDGSGAATDVNAFTWGDETAVGLGVRRRFLPPLDIEVDFALSETDGGTDDAQDGPADTLGFYGFQSLEHMRRSSVDTRAHLRSGGATLTGGWEVEAERVRAFTDSRSAFGPSSDRSESERLNRAYYAHVTGARGGLAFDAGARLESNDRYGNAGTWQAGVVWSFREGTRLRARAGSAIKEPTFFETFATGFARGNPDLDPERARSWEVGLDRSFAAGRGTVRATWFDKRVTDLIQYTFMPPVAGGANYFNVASAASRGVETEAEVTLGRASASASWTWLDTEVVDAGFDEGPSATFVEGERLLRRPAHTVALNTVLAVGTRLWLDGSVLRVGARADRDFSTFPATPVELEAHTLVSGGARATLKGAAAGGSGVELGVRVRNLLDERYEEAFGFRAPGRSLWVEARVRVGG